MVDPGYTMLHPKKKILKSGNDFYEEKPNDIVTHENQP